MKYSPKTVCRAFCAIFAVVAGLAWLATTALGIQGLKVSIQNGTNLMLSWPSVTNATYIIQYTPTLNVTNGWQTLTNFYPAFPNTN
jgi:hypothetical protein